MNERPRVTPEMLTREKAKVGVPIARLQPHAEFATKDAIRHWAEGIGDRNPLWRDERYARESVWQGLVAPPTFVLAMDKNIVRARGFRGIHGWHMRTTFEWSDVIRKDQSLVGASTIESVAEVTSRYAGGAAYDQVIRTDLVEPTSGRTTCVTRSVIRRFEREAGRAAAKYKRAKSTYTDEQIEDTAEAYRHEQIRGATPRYIDDVSVAERVPEIVRGPLTITDCVAFVIGWGGAYIFAHGFAYDFRREHAGVFPPNESNIPDSPERTHWSDAFAQAIGAPAAFDYGPQRIAWCGTLLTNWIGDAGFLKRLDVLLVRPNYHGDLLRIGGTVTAVDRASGEATVSFEGINQLGEAVVSGDATVRLPKRPSV